MSVKIPYKIKYDIMSKILKYLPDPDHCMLLMGVNTDDLEYLMQRNVHNSTQNHYHLTMEKMESISVKCTNCTTQMILSLVKKAETKFDGNLNDFKNRSTPDFTDRFQFQYGIWETSEMILKISTSYLNIALKKENLFPKMQ